MSSSKFHERLRSNPLCDFRLGTVATSDHETPLTGYEPKKDLNLVNTEELDLAATSDIYWQHTLDDDASLNDPNVDDNQLAKYLAVVVDSTGKPVEMRSSNDQFSCDTRNLKGAQSQFPVVPQTEMICQTGGSVQARIAEERENAHAQIRTMFDEQRRMIIAECSEKVLHHELLAAHAEQDRKVLQEELLRQQQEFADAVSAYTQVKMEDAHKLFKIPKSECPDIWIRLPRHKWPKSWSRMEDPVVPLERNLYGHPLAGLLWERQFEKVLLKHGWEKIPNWDCLFVHREKGLFLSVYVDDVKLAGKKHNILIRCGKNSIKKLI